VRIPWEATRLATWTTACLRGDVSPDDLTEHAVAPHEVHRVAGHGSLAVAVAEFRRRGARSAWLAWPVAGDVAALPGPPDFNGLALAAGQAVLVDVADDAGGPRGLVPSRLGSSGILWTELPVGDLRATRTSLAEAERSMRTVVREATEALDALDVGRTSEDVAARVEQAREQELPLDLPPGHPGRARLLLDTSQRLVTLLDLALSDEGGAIGRRDADERRARLREVARGVRHAFVAAANALAEESARAR
jgi:hypothetical protein